MRPYLNDLNRDQSNPFVALNCLNQTALNSEVIKHSDIMKLINKFIFSRIKHA